MKCKYCGDAIRVKTYANSERLHGCTEWEHVATRDFCCSRNSRGCGINFISFATPAEEPTTGKALCDNCGEEIFLKNVPGGISYWEHSTSSPICSNPHNWGYAFAMPAGQTYEKLSKYEMVKMHNFMMVAKDAAINTFANECEALKKSISALVEQNNELAKRLEEQKDTTPDGQMYKIASGLTDKCNTLLREQVEQVTRERDDATTKLEVANAQLKLVTQQRDNTQSEVISLRDRVKVNEFTIRTQSDNWQLTKQEKSELREKLEASKRKLADLRREWQYPTHACNNCGGEIVSSKFFGSFTHYWTHKANRNIVCSLGHGLRAALAPAKDTAAETISKQRLESLNQLEKMHDEVRTVLTAASVPLDTSRTTSLAMAQRIIDERNTLRAERDQSRLEYGSLLDRFEAMRTQLDELKAEPRYRVAGDSKRCKQCGKQLQFNKDHQWIHWNTGNTDCNPCVHMCKVCGTEIKQASNGFWLHVLTDHAPDACKEYYINIKPREMEAADKRHTCKHCGDEIDGRSYYHRSTTYSYWYHVVSGSKHCVSQTDKHAAPKESTPND